MQAKPSPLLALLLVGVVAVSSAHAAPQSVSGRTVFDNNCASCHSVDANLSSRAGPGLFGLQCQGLGHGGHHGLFQQQVEPGLENSQCVLGVERMGG